MWRVEIVPSRGSIPRKLVLEIGRTRISMIAGWRPRRFRWGWRQDPLGAWSVGFGFGVLTYLRRWPSRA